MRMGKAVGIIAAAISAFAMSTGDASAGTALVGYDPSAPEGNFSAPGPTSDQVAYTVSLSEDATYLYGTIAANPAAGGTYNSGLLFSNLYFGLGSSATTSSTLGIEVTNDQAFIPGVSGYTSLAGTGFTYSENAATGVISFALPWSFLETDPLNMGFDKVSSANPDAIVRDSQSFGYSVAGGNTFGTNRLGIEAAPVPVPSSLLLFCSGSFVLGIGAWKRRRPSRQRGGYAEV